MCVGVTKGLAGTKFSGSIRKYGFVLLIKNIVKIIKLALTKSLYEK
jgi:hypothetical protein